MTRWKTRARFTLLAFASAAVLSACGGGGDDDGPCGGAGTLSLNVTYEVNGALVDPTRTTVLTRGSPVLAVPRAVGLPAACAGKERITHRVLGSVPTGLSVNATTGAFSGTPTELGSLRIELRLGVEGYTSEVRQTVDFIM
jgi:hypothetical protein